MIQNSHKSSHLLVVLDLVLEDDSVGSLRLLPRQRHSVSGDVLGLDGGNRRRRWRKTAKGTTERV